jgi:glycosyltransferase involved in cell wall biosynthesis
VENSSVDVEPQPAPPSDAPGVRRGVRRRAADTDGVPAGVRDTTVAVAWSGLPPYGLNNIRALMAHFGVLPIVVGTRPDLSYDAIEKVSGLPVHWIDPADATASWSRLGTPVPEVLIVSGWAMPAFNELGRQVRANGGAVIVRVDNRWRGDLRQWLAPLVFNTKYRGWFKAAIVPGKAARRFVRFLGIPNDAIFEGLYSGNPHVFVPGPPLHERPQRLLFVGRFEERKGVRELAAAWQSVQPQIPGWQLHAVGEGPLQSVLEGSPGVVVHRFQQLRQLAGFYQSSRFLVLPSHEDHWGVVVHEAAKSGCGLLLSENVGAGADLANAVNSFSFPPRQPAAIAAAILRAARLDDAQLRAAYHESLALSYRFGPQVFADAVVRAIGRLRSRA